jgi:hypothetical protein
LTDGDKPELTTVCTQRTESDKPTVKNKHVLTSSNLIQGCSKYVERNMRATKAYAIWVRNISKERGHLGNLTLKETILYT